MYRSLLVMTKGYGEMNLKLGFYGSVINLCAVIAFAVSMLVRVDYASYLSSFFIAIGFILMMCAYAGIATEDNKAMGFATLVFTTIYAILIVFVYYTQMTTVQLEELNEQAARILDYQSFGLMFNFDLLGYGFMAAATFFASFLVLTKTKADRWLKVLLRIHGIFAISCFVLPLLGVFTSDMKGGDLIGVAVLEFWCVYFIPVGILSILHFKRK